jgi:hypothetical protein
MPYVSARTRTSDSQPAPGSMTLTGKTELCGRATRGWARLGAVQLYAPSWGREQPLGFSGRMPAGAVGHRTIRAVIRAGEGVW